MAPDPVKAMAALERSVSDNDPYHALILDFQMPNENGVELAARIQANPNFGAIPILILSSVENAPAAASQAGARISAYLSKPVRPSQIMDALAQSKLGYQCIPITELIGKKGKNQKSMADLDPKDVFMYACEDADITWQLADTLLPELEKEGLMKGKLEVIIKLALGKLML